jgi:acyl carrier protein
MTVEQRILKCLNEITDVIPSKEEPLHNYGLDSLDIMDLLYGIEREFDVKNAFDIKLVGLKTVSLQQIESQLQTAMS